MFPFPPFLFFFALRVLNDILSSFFERVVRNKRPTPTVSPNEIWKKKKKYFYIRSMIAMTLASTVPILHKNRRVHAVSSYLPYRLDEQTVWDEIPLFLDLDAPCEKSPAQKKKKERD